MRHAPSVSFPVGRCAFWVALLLFLGLSLGLVTAIAWSGLAHGQAGALSLAVVCWWLAAARHVRRQPQGWLRYHAPPGAHVPGDAAWTWLPDPAGEPVPLVGLCVVLDLQQRLLLQASGAAGVPRWIWLEAARAPADWLALRRAVLAGAAR